MPSKRRVRTPKKDVIQENNNTDSSRIANGSAAPLNPLAQGTALKAQFRSITVDRRVVYREVKTVYANGTVENTIEVVPNNTQETWVGQ